MAAERVTGGEVIGRHPRIEKSSVARACYICGRFMGITPNDNQRGFALMHRYRIFNGYQEFGQRTRLRHAGAPVAFPARLNSDDGYEQTQDGDPPTSRRFGWRCCAASTSSRSAWS